MHLSTLWRSALLSASRTLRQDQITASSSSSPLEEGSRPYLFSYDPFAYPEAYSSPPSLSPSPSFEEDDSFTSNTNTNSNTSSSFGSVGPKQAGKRYRTLGRSTRKSKAGSVGHVRGLVENWERGSASESEGEGEGSERRVPPVPAPAFGVSNLNAAFNSTSSSSGSWSHSPASSTSSTSSALTSDYITAPSTPSSSSFGQKDASLPHPHLARQKRKERAKEQEGNERHIGEEEPSIETLLTQSENTWPRGARAWETMYASGMNVTVKQVPAASENHRVPASIGKGFEGNSDLDAEAGGAGRSVVGWEDDDG